jgi:hypothetical protein
MVNLIAESGDAVVRTRLPRAIRVLDDLRIPLSDGTELSARVAMTCDAAQFRLEGELTASEDGTVLGTRQIETSIPRRFA